MTLENVKKLRELYGEDDLIIFGDNAKIANSSKKHIDLIWDDVNELLYIVRHNADHYTSKEQPINIDTLEYEFIQYMGTNTSIDGGVRILESLIGESLIDQEKLKSIIDKYK